MNKIRLTIDLDSDSLLRLSFSLFKGFLVAGKLPEEIKRTQRGFHLIYYGIEIPYEKNFAYRKFIGDDESRIKLDMHKKRIAQIMFDEKKAFVRIGSAFYRAPSCSICGVDLPYFFVFLGGKFYCSKCFKMGKRAKARYLAKKSREKAFLSFIGFLKAVLAKLAR